MGFAEQIDGWEIRGPLTEAGVEAAIELRQSHLPGWFAAARALSEMREELSASTLASFLGRSAAVNDLYNAQLGSAVLPVARFMFELQQRGELVLPEDSAADVVERIGRYGRSTKDLLGCQVFASKYAHFFVDPDRFPVYDKYAARALLFHWGSFEPSVMDGASRYRHFCTVLDRVLAASELDDVSLGDVDAYLWLAGIYREWLRRGKHAAINSEAKKLFERSKGEPGLERLLAQLRPEGPFTEDLPRARVAS